MKKEEFAYGAETRKEFSEAVVSVLREVERKGWTVFGVYDIRERLAARGFSHPPLKIIEICSGKYADRFLNQDKMVSLCMPCKINVMEENGRVKLITMRPGLMRQFFPEMDEKDAQEAEKELKEIVDRAAGTPSGETK
ncbi:MAG: DUF302 domain-containing protein [Candidatus Diapherotrites archaeon]|nr:DUF302 domain-containing protein [Candidatus Diapherotrites archaeon]